MYKEEAVLKDIRERLSDFRYIHSLEVAKSAKELALRYNADPEKAYIAGLSHDVLKELSEKEYFDFFEAEGVELSQIERITPTLWHSIAGAKYLEKTYGFDADIISAVRYHTTGKADMSLLEKIIFVADFISLDRDYPGVDEMRERAKHSLEYTMEEGLRFTLEKLAKKCLPMHTDTVDCYNQILLEKRG